MAIQQAEGVGNAFVLIIKPLPDLLHLCGLELFGSRLDFGGVFLLQERRCIDVAYFG